MLLATSPALFDCLAAGLTEDCPYGDITTELLAIEGQGCFQFISRVDAVVSGTPRLAEFFAGSARCCTRRRSTLPARQPGHKQEEEKT